MKNNKDQTIVLAAYALLLFLIYRASKSPAFRKAFMGMFNRMNSDLEEAADSVTDAWVIDLNKVSKDADVNYAKRRDAQTALELGELRLAEIRKEAALAPNEDLAYWSDLRQEQEDDLDALRELISQLS